MGDALVGVRVAQPLGGHEGTLRVQWAETGCELGFDRRKRERILVPERVFVLDIEQEVLVVAVGTDAALPSRHPAPRPCFIGPAAIRLHAVSRDEVRPGAALLARQQVSDGRIAGGVLVGVQPLPGEALGPDGIGKRVDKGK